MNFFPAGQIRQCFQDEHLSLLRQEAGAESVFGNFNDFIFIQLQGLLCGKKIFINVASEISRIIRIDCHSNSLVKHFFRLWSSILSNTLSLIFESGHTVKGICSRTMRSTSFDLLYTALHDLSVKLPAHPGSSNYSGGPSSPACATLRNPCSGLWRRRVQNFPEGIQLLTNQVLLPQSSP
ncbi:MAG: hypothetical protein CM1200mP30_25720 [Pseudomonadota bacterium]|nr:MAG: hypothetical protein CM1200mP30_25720 [Pseudomonadota bacterium]